MKKNQLKPKEELVSKELQSAMAGTPAETRNTPAVNTGEEGKSVQPVNASAKRKPAPIHFYRRRDIY